MPKKMGKNNTPQAAPAINVVEPVVVPVVEPTDTVELAGNAIEVVDDWSHLVGLSEGPTLLLDKDNRDVRRSKPEWHFAWFTEKDADKWEMYGFKKVHLQFGDEIRAAGQSQKRREDNGCVQYLSKDEAQYAYCIETTRYESYLNYIQKHQVISTEQIQDAATGVFREHAGEFADAVVDAPGEGIGERKIT